MKRKVYNIGKTFAILSSGVVLVVGVKQMRIRDYNKLVDRLDDVKIHFSKFDDHPKLNNAYSNLAFTVLNSSCLKNKYDKVSYEIYNFIPSISSGLVSYTFYDDYIYIRRREIGGNDYYSCCYYNDGSYSITCECENNIKKIDSWFEYHDSFDSVTYNFSSSGVLNNSLLHGNEFSVKFEYVDGNISDFSYYTFYNNNADFDSKISYYNSLTGGNSYEYSLLSQFSHNTLIKK